jgi:hypothetical protein
MHSVDINHTVMYTICAFVGFVSKTHIIMTRNENVKIAHQQVKPYKALNMVVYSAKYFPDITTYKKKRGVSLDTRLERSSFRYILCIYEDG